MTKKKRPDINEDYQAIKQPVYDLLRIMGIYDAVCVDDKKQVEKGLPPIDACCLDNSKRMIEIRTGDSNSGENQVIGFIQEAQRLAESEPAWFPNNKAGTTSLGRFLERCASMARMLIAKQDVLATAVGMVGHRTDGDPAMVVLFKEMNRAHRQLENVTMVTGKCITWATENGMIASVTPGMPIPGGHADPASVN